MSRRRAVIDSTMDQTSNNTVCENKSKKDRKAVGERIHCFSWVLLV